jgi:hypothetical protein
MNCRQNKRDDQGRPLIAAELFGDLLWPAQMNQLCGHWGGHRCWGCRNIFSESQAPVAVAMGPNQSSQADSIELSSRDQPASYIR